MKKFFPVFVFLFLAISLVSGVSIKIKSQYDRGENFVASISGNFVQPLSEEQIHFYRGHTETFFGNFNLSKIGKDYYVSLRIPLEKPEDNYSIAVENVKYKSLGEEKESSFNESFKISDKIVPFYISPPFMISKKNYEVELESLLDKDISVDFLGEYQNFNFSLESGSLKNIELNLGNSEKLVELNFLYNGKNYSSYIYEYGKEGNIYVSPDSNETIKINKTSGNKTNSTTGNESGGGFDWDIFDLGEDEENGSEDLEIQTCDELGGIVCNESSVCEGDLRNSKNSKCCIGTCVAKGENSWGKIIGWILIVVVVLFLTWFFKSKYKGTGKSPINLFKKSNLFLF